MDFEFLLHRFGILFNFLVLLHSIEIAYGAYWTCMFASREANFIIFLRKYCYSR